jgi:hypothetical protein
VSDHRNFPQQSRRYYNLPWDWHSSGVTGQVCPSTEAKR